VSTYNWLYENKVGEEEEIKCDVLVLGGGLAGCYAAIAATRNGSSVVIVKKANYIMDLKLKDVEETALIPLAIKAEETSRKNQE